MKIKILRSKNDIIIFTPHCIDLRVKVISINLYVFHLNVMDDLKLHTIREIYVYFLV